jgi:hypothetical protein
MQKVRMFLVLDVLALLCAASAVGQVQMECRLLDGSNNFLRPDEVIIKTGDNQYQACHPVKENPVKVEPAAAATPATPQAVVASSAAVPAATSAPAPAPAPAATSNAAAGAVQPSAHRQCLILKRMGPADEITSHMYSFGIRGKQFQYVEGDFPSGVSFHGRLTDHDVRNIQKHGGKVVMMEPKYTADDLREAKQSCKDE